MLFLSCFFVIFLFWYAFCYKKFVGMKKNILLCSPIQETYKDKVK